MSIPRLRHYLLAVPAALTLVAFTVPAEPSHPREATVAPERKPADLPCSAPEPSSDRPAAVARRSRRD